MTRHHAGHLWTLTGDRWIADPDLVVTTSGSGKRRTYSPGRDAAAVYDKLEEACKIEARIARAESDLAALVAHAERERIAREQEERDRALAALDLARAIKAREREAATESTRAAERMALAERRTALRWAAGLTVAAVALVVCAGVWGVS